MSDGFRIPACAAIAFKLAATYPFSAKTEMAIRRRFSLGMALDGRPALRFFVVGLVDLIGIYVHNPFIFFDYLPCDRYIVCLDPLITFNGFFY